MRQTSTESECIMAVVRPIHVHSKICELNEWFPLLNVLNYEIHEDSGELLFSPQFSIHPYPNIGFFGTENMELRIPTILESIEFWEARTFSINDEYVMLTLSKANYDRVVFDRNCLDEEAGKAAEQSYKRVIELTASDFGWSLVSTVEGTCSIERAKQPLKISREYDNFASEAFCGLAMIAVRRNNAGWAVGFSMSAMEIGCDCVDLVHAVRLAALAKGMHPVLHQLARFVFLRRVPPEHAWREWSLFDCEATMQLGMEMAEDEQNRAMWEQIDAIERV